MLSAKEYKKRLKQARIVMTEDRRLYDKFTKFIKHVKKRRQAKTAQDNSGFIRKSSISQDYFHMLYEKLQPEQSMLELKNQLATDKR